MKILLRVLFGLVLLVIAVFAALLIFIDPLVKTAIEKGASYATGVETRLDSVSAGLFSSKLDLSGLRIQNPPGFRPEPFASLGQARAAWQGSSLFGDEIHIDEFDLDGVEINLERADGKTNYGVILANLEKISGEKKAPAPSSGDKPKKLVIKRILVRDVKATVSMSGLPIGNGSASVKVPKVEIDDFQSDGSTTEVVGKLVAQILQSVLDETVKAGQDILPKDVLKDLGGNLKNLKGEAKKLLDSLKPIGGFELPTGKKK